MDLKQFYEHLLRLSDPWYVDSVKIDDQGNRVDQRQLLLRDDDNYT
jgi:hypothetical protein